MPCDSVRTTTLKFEAANLDVLEAALKTVEGVSRVRMIGGGFAFDYEGATCSFRNGRMTLPDGSDVNEFKRAYAREAVRSQAARFGWTMKAATTAQASSAFTRKW